MVFRNIWKSFTRVITLSLFVHRRFFYLRHVPLRDPSFRLVGTDMMVGKSLLSLSQPRNGWRMRDFTQQELYDELSPLADEETAETGRTTVQPVQTLTVVVAGKYVLRSTVCVV